jgi:hypothetical protein
MFKLQRGISVISEETQSLHKTGDEGTTSQEKLIYDQREKTTKQLYL